MIDLNEIAIFTKVVESGSFTAGAKQSGLPKATVSRKISDLETRLGVRLLERTTRKLRLTEEGREYYLRCNQHVAAIEEAHDAVSETQAEPQGVLRISMPTVGQRFLSNLIAEFSLLYPKVRFEVIFTDQLVDLISENFDLAFRAGYLEDSSLIARNLGPTEPLICASPTYLERFDTPQQPDALRQHNCIILNTSADNTIWRFHGPNGPESIQVSGNIVTNDVNFVLHTALAGMGIARLPSFVVAEYLKTDRLRTVLSDWNPTFGSVYVIYPSRRHLPTRVKIFLQFLEEKMQPKPPWISDSD